MLYSWKKVLKVPLNGFSYMDTHRILVLSKRTVGGLHELVQLNFGDAIKLLRNRVLITWHAQNHSSILKPFKKAVHVLSRKVKIFWIILQSRIPPLFERHFSDHCLTRWLHFEDRVMQVRWSGHEGLANQFLLVL